MDTIPMLSGQSQVDTGGKVSRSMVTFPGGWIPLLSVWSTVASVGIPCSFRVVL